MVLNIFTQAALDFSQYSMQHFYFYSLDNRLISTFSLLVYIHALSHGFSYNTVLYLWTNKRKKKKKLQRCNKSHICPDHPHCATPTKIVMWCGVPDLDNHAKFHQNRPKSSGSLRGRNLPFSYA